MSHPCAIARTDHGHSVVLHLVGEFDLASVDVLRGAISEAVATSRHLVLDLRDTTFIDSVCLGAIIGGRNAAQSVGGWVRLVSPRSAVLRVLQITGLDKVLGVYPDVDECTSDLPAHALEAPAV